MKKISRGMAGLSCAAALVALSACGGGGSEPLPASGQVSVKVKPEGTVALAAGNTLNIHASAKAYFSAMDTHRWEARQLSGTPAPDAVSFSDPQCQSAVAVPGYAASPGMPGRNATSECANVLRVALETPLSEWEVVSTARTTNGSASDRFVLRISPSVLAQSGFTLSVPTLPLSAQLNEAVSLATTVSFNEGITPDEPVSYEWSQVSGPNVALAGRNTATMAFVPRSGGDYVFEVKANAKVRGKNETRQGAVVVLVNSAAVNLSVSAGTLQVAEVGEPATLSGTVSGSDNARVLWSQVDGPTEVTLFNADTLNPQFTPTEAGDYVFELLVTHLGQPTVTKTARTQVSAYVPDAVVPFFAVNAGTAQVVERNQPVQLSATVQNGQPAPSGLTYSWTQVAGPAVSLSGASSLQASFVALQAGTYEFEFRASTATSPAVSKSDRTVVQVLSATEPNFNVNAGSIQLVQVGATAQLNGVLNGASLADVNVAWSQVSGPSATLFGQSSLQAQFVPAEAGEYVFELRAASKSDATNVRTDRTLVVAAAQASLDFALSAGDAQVVGPNNAVVLQGELVEGAVPARTVSHQWTQLSGPAVNLANAQSLRASFVPPEPALYTFGLTSTLDGVSKSAVTSVQVLAVTPAP